MRIALGADHRGYRLKERLREWLAASGHSPLDLGTAGTGPVDYPEYGFLVADAVRSRRARFGILVCGTGIGMSMAANRVRGVRAAVANDERLARMSRRHNNANVICLGGDLLTAQHARRVVGAWLRTGFEGGRHTRRLRRLDRGAGGTCR